MRVLLIEDHADTAQTTAMILRMAGYDVEVAPDGEMGVAAARARQPDVVLLDIGLPGMNGWQVAQELLSQPAQKRPLLVATSGFGGEEAPSRSLEAGIDLHLVKPVDPEYLQKLLSRFRRVIEWP
jgi:two-component system CheB/CheR fusion protein